MTNAGVRGRPGAPLGIVVSDELGFLLGLGPFRNGSYVGGADGAG